MKKFTEQTIQDNNNSKSREMIEEIAEVIRIEPGYAYIKPGNGQGCSSCSSRGGCGSGGCGSGALFITKNWINRSSIRVQNPLYAKPGDTVIVGIKPATLLGASLLAYMLPLISLLIAAGFGHVLFAAAGLSVEAGSMLLGIAGLFAGFWIAGLLLKNPFISKDFDAVILRIREPETHPVTMLNQGA